MDETFGLGNTLGLGETLGLIEGIPGFGGDVIPSASVAVEKHPMRPDRAMASVHARALEPARCV